MSRSFILILAIALVSCAGVLLASEDTASWGEVKTMYAGNGEKVLFPDPWPVPYETDGSVNEITAKKAMMKVGWIKLLDYTDVKVYSPGGYEGTEYVAVYADRPDGDRETFFVDTNQSLMVQNLIITDGDDYANFSAYDVLNNTYSNINDIEAMVDAGDGEETIYAACEMAGIENVTGIRDGWNKLKDMWGEMSMCQQMVTVSGAVVCGTASLGGFAGVLCGGAFVFVYAQC